MNARQEAVLRTLRRMEDAWAEAPTTAEVQAECEDSYVGRHGAVYEALAKLVRDGLATGKTLARAGSPRVWSLSDHGRAVIANIDAQVEGRVPGCPCAPGRVCASHRPQD